MQTDWGIKNDDMPYMQMEDAIDLINMVLPSWDKSLHFQPEKSCIQ